MNITDICDRFIDSNRREGVSRLMAMRSGEVCFYGLPEARQRCS